MSRQAWNPNIARHQPQTFYSHVQGKAQLTQRQQSRGHSSDLGCPSERSSALQHPYTKQGGNQVAPTWSVGKSTISNDPQRRSNLDHSPQSRNEPFQTRKLVPSYTNSPAIYREKFGKHKILKHSSLAAAMTQHNRDVPESQRYGGSLPPISMKTVDSHKKLKQNLMMAITNERTFSSSSGRSLERQGGNYLRSQPEHYYGSSDIEASTYASQRLETLKPKHTLPPIHTKPLNQNHEIKSKQADKLLSRKNLKTNLEKRRLDWNSHVAIHSIKTFDAMKVEKYVYLKENTVVHQRPIDEPTGSDQAVSDIQRFLQNAILLEMMQDSERVSVTSLKQKDRLELVDHPYRKQTSRASNSKAISPYMSTLSRDSNRVMPRLDQPLRLSKASTERSEYGDDQQGSRKPSESRLNYDPVMHDFDEAQLTEKQAVWIRRTIHNQVMNLRHINRGLNEQCKQGQKKVNFINKRIQQIKGLIGERQQEKIDSKLKLQQEEHRIRNRQISQASLHSQSEGQGHHSILPKTSVLDIKVVKSPHDAKTVIAMPMSPQLSPISNQSQKKEKEKEQILFSLIEEEKAMDDEWDDNNNTWTDDKNECENILSEVQDLEAEKMQLKAKIADLESDINFHQALHSLFNVSNSDKKKRN